MNIKRASERSDDPRRGGDDDRERSINVQIVAASATVRAGLSALIGAEEHLIVSGAYTSAAEAAQEPEAAPGAQPDVIVVELGEASDEWIAELTPTQEEADTRAPALIALVPDSQLESVTNLLRSGVRAVLPRSASGDEIVAAIEAVSAGLTVFHRDAARALMSEPGEDLRNEQTSAASVSPPGQEPDALTPREIEVLGLIAEGLGNKTIAYRLGISEHTVKFHVASIMSKLDASSRTEAVTQGVRRGFIML